jgi:hypothetical protein
MPSSGGYFPFLSYSSFSLRFGWMELLFAWCGHLLRDKLLTTPLSISWFVSPIREKCSVQRSRKKMILGTVLSHYHGVASICRHTADAEGNLGVFSGSDNWYILLLVTTRLTKQSVHTVLVTTRLTKQSVHTAVSHHTPHKTVGTHCC